MDALIQLANDRGGPDNISVVVARVLGDEADEADTERGFPVLPQAFIPTSRADLSSLADATTAPSTALPDPVHPPEQPIADPATQPATFPTPTPPAPIPTPTQPPSVPVQADIEPPLHHHDPTPPLTPVPGQRPARPNRAAAPQRRGSRGGGVVLLAVLVLLVLLGAGIGFILYRMAGVGP